MVDQWLKILEHLLFVLSKKNFSKTSSSQNMKKIEVS